VARATSAEALVAHLRLAIEKLRHDLYGSRSEHGRKLLGQMELELEDLVTTACPAIRSIASICRPSPRPSRPAPSKLLGLDVAL
jgi:hypothetical protein